MALKYLSAPGVAPLSPNILFIWLANGVMFMSIQYPFAMPSHTDSLPACAARIVLSSNSSQSMPAMRKFHASVGSSARMLTLSHIWRYTAPSSPRLKEFFAVTKFDSVQSGARNRRRIASCACALRGPFVALPVERRRFRPPKSALTFSAVHRAMSSRVISPDAIFAACLDSRCWYSKSAACVLRWAPMLLNSQLVARACVLRNSAYCSLMPAKCPSALRVQSADDCSARTSSSCFDIIVRPARTSSMSAGDCSMMALRPA